MDVWSSGVLDFSFLRYINVGRGAGRKYVQLGFDRLHLVLDQGKKKSMLWRLVALLISSVRGV